MKPTMQRVLVKVRADKGKKVEGTSVMTADVLSVGPDVKRIKTNDVVVFSPYGIDEVVIGGEKHIIIAEDLILAVHDKEKTNTKAKG